MSSTGRWCSCLATAGLLAAGATTARAQLNPQRQPITRTLALAAPSGVTVAAARGGIAVGWQGVINAASYEIQRAPDATSAAAAVGTAPAGAVSFLDASMSARGPAWYQVVSVAADGRRATSARVQLVTTAIAGTATLANTATLSSATPMASATTLMSSATLAASSTLAAPSAVTVAATKAGIAIRWQGGAGAASYEVLRAPDATSAEAVVGRAAAGSASYVDPTMSAAGPAWYEVVSIAADGRRAASGRVQLPPPPPIPVLLTTSATTVSPGDVVTLTGTNLTGVTSVHLQRAVTGATWTMPPIDAPATAVTATSLRFTMPLTSDMKWARETLTPTVTTANGTGTLSAPITLDRVAVITGVVKPVVRAGQPITVNGRNLDRVNAGYIGLVAPGTASNPRMAASGGWQGLTATLYTTADCNRQGGLMLEEYPPENPNVGGTSSSYVSPSGTTIAVGCGITPTGTSVTPLAAPGGSSVVVGGKGFKWITDVVTGSTKIPWQLVSDTELHLTLPAQQPSPGNASAPLSVQLLNNVPDPTIAGSITPAPIVLLPPAITSVYPSWGETGMLITVSGKSLGQAEQSWGGATLPAVTPVVMVNGTGAAELRSVSPQSFTFNPGVGSTSGPITVTTGGGTASWTGPFFVPSGPTAIESISPASARAGDVITVSGQNLVRARGVCFPPYQVNTLGQAFAAKAGDFNAPTSNTTFQVTVPAGVTSGAIGFATAPSVTQPQYVVCVANPNPVTFTVTP